MRPVTGEMMAEQVKIENGSAVERGIVLADGGACPKVLVVFLREETLLPIIIAENKFTCVEFGEGKVLDDEPILEQSRFS